MVVGLGNPGAAYARTRHNAGFDVIDELARRHGAEFRRSFWTGAHTAEVRVGGEAVLLVKPQGYMNRSGGPAASLARKKGVKPDGVLVVVDDVDLPLGRLRLRPGGGSGGHNGMRSMIEHLGTDAFPRVRVGVGRPAEGEVADHVLSRFTPDERKTMDEATVRAADAVEAVLEKGLEKAANVYNK
jgi:PTH1 family peptidyl-tRNA hydrolase